MSPLSLLARAAVSILLLHYTPQAEAQTRPACAAREEVVERLADQFGETLRSIGLQRNDGVVEVFASDKTGTWTILMTRADGVSCLLAAGSYWADETRPAEKPGKDA